MLVQSLRNDLVYRLFGAEQVLVFCCSGTVFTPVVSGTSSSILAAHFIICVTDSVVCVSVAAGVWFFFFDLLVETASVPYSQSSDCQVLSQLQWCQDENKPTNQTGV